MNSFDLRKWKGFCAAGGDNSEDATVQQVCTDTRLLHADPSLFIALEGSYSDGHNYLAAAASGGARFAVVRKSAKLPSIPGLSYLRVDSPLESFQEIAACYRKELACKVVAVTGSYGKTLLKDLLGELLSTKAPTWTTPESFNSQVGVPLSLFTIDKHHAYAVVETGISHPGEMEKLVALVQADYGILTCISDAHLATLESLETTATEKDKLLQSIPSSSWILTPSSHPSKGAAKAYYWDQIDPSLPSVQGEVDSVRGLLNYTLCFPSGRRFSSTWSTGFKYGLQLIQQAVCAAYLLGVQETSIIHVLSTYHPHTRKTQVWRLPSGTPLLSTPHSEHELSLLHTLKDLGSIPKRGKRYFIYEQGSSSSPSMEKHYAQGLMDARVDTCLFVGASPPPLPSAIPCKNVPSVREAIKQLRQELGPKDTLIVQSPDLADLTHSQLATGLGLGDNRLWVNLSAIKANLQLIRHKMRDGGKIMAMCKAQAYGTDPLLLGQYLAREQVECLGVATLEEAETLREGGIECDIFLIHASDYQVEQVVSLSLTASVGEWNFLRALQTEAAKQGRVQKVHLHINTGMSRFGCRPEAALEMALWIESASHLDLEGVLTHFACAEDPKDDAFTLSQIKQFRHVIQELAAKGIHPPLRHCANTPAFLRMDLDDFNMIRVGVGLYGLYGSEAMREKLPLQPALSLTSRIVTINTCQVGETVSYGKLFTVKRPNTRIAIIPLGYFDGLHQNYSQRGHVLIHGKQAPMVGSICMDFLMADITDIDEAQVGDEVLIFGEDRFGNCASPEAIADAAQVGVRELITCLGPRIQRVFTLDN